MEVSSDTLSEPAKKGVLASVLDWLVDGYWPAAEHADDGIITTRSPQRLYALKGLLAIGDVAELHYASDQSAPRVADVPYVLKVSRFVGADGLLSNERKLLARLLAAAGTTTYRRYLPTLVESFEAVDKIRKRVNVFLHEPEFYTLEQVHAQHPALDGRHLAWIFKRLLTVLGFSHRQNAIHTAVLPGHVLVHADNHGLQLVGWGHSVEKGEPIKTISPRYRDWYPVEALKQQPAAPETDIFLAARCLVYLAGGDPLCNWMPDSVPEPLQRFLKSCLLERPSMRPNDAWALLDDFDQLLL